MRDLPEIVKKANNSLKRAANHLSLALSSKNNEFLFLGDVESFEIKQIVENLQVKNKNKFNIFITPHHGTHWDNSLKKIRCDCSIASNGSKMYPKTKNNYNYISEMQLSTHVKGDIKIYLGPLYKFCIDYGCSNRSLICYCRKSRKYSYKSFTFILDKCFTSL